MTAVAVLVTLAAAVLFAVSSVLEQRSTKKVPERGTLSVRLVRDLARRPAWIAAITVNVAGNILQIVALHVGELALVQPLLVCDLLFAVVFAVLLRHRSPDWVIVAGVVCCAGGVACFLAVARPHGGHGEVSLMAALPLIAALAAVLAGCLAAARWSPRRARALWLALACGADFGVTAFLLKLVPDTLPHGFSDPLQQWPLYLLIIVGPLGFLLNQNAFQASDLVAPVLAVITTVDPLVSIGIAHVWLNERVTSSPAGPAAEALSLAVMTAGIAALAHRAPASPAPDAPDAAGSGPRGSNRVSVRGQRRPC
jgi:drug/metabolite transporter (DMT)-like permease